MPSGSEPLWRRTASRSSSDRSKARSICARSLIRLRDCQRQSFHSKTPVPGNMRFRKARDRSPIGKRSPCGRGAGAGFGFGLSKEKTQSRDWVAGLVRLWVVGVPSARLPCGGSRGPERETVSISVNAPSSDRGAVRRRSPAFSTHPKRAAFNPSARICKRIQSYLPIFFDKRGNPSLHSPSVRSEEHTSELQSLMRISYAVFCLKKKNN